MVVEDRRDDEKKRKVFAREIERAMKRFDASLEWPSERIGMMDEEMERIRHDEQTEGRVKTERLKR